MAPKPKPKWKVKLRIKTEPAPDYTESSVAGYYYKFSGGNTTAKNGDIDISSQTSDGITFQVALAGRSNRLYDLKSGNIKDSSSDISISHPSGNRITVTDTELQNNVTVRYGVTVNPHGATSPDIVCDPTIKHRW
jgi:hypothetical protein